MDSTGRRRTDRVVDRARELAAGDGGGVLDGVAGGAVHLRRAAQRVGVLDPVALVGPVRCEATIAEPAISAVRLAADSAWPGCGRMACSSAAKTRSVPSWPSTLIAAATSAVRSSIRRSVIAMTSMPSMPSVPLMRARPSLATSSTGSRPAAASASAAGISVPSASRTSPSPISASAQCESGREVAGAAERAVLPHDRGDAVRQQVGHQLRGLAAYAGVPVASVESRSSISARTTSRSTSGPEPAACERTSERWSWARISVGMCRVASAPKPVLIPDQPAAVRPFLINLFSDPNIITAPGPIRWLLARLIAWRRTSKAQEIYAKIGGGSPIVSETRKQAIALQDVLRAQGYTKLRCFTVMRYWNPRAKDIVEQLKEFAPDHVVLLPLYPQFSTTTTKSSLQEWHAMARSYDFRVNSHEICCYPDQPDFIMAHAALIQAQAPQYFGPAAGKKARLLFSAHGLPQRIVDAGDPYPEQVAQTASAIAARLGIASDAWEICYQSRVGPLKWLGPSTEERLKAAGEAGSAVVLVPIAFVSEHSETLVELDMEYRHLAEQAGVPDIFAYHSAGCASGFYKGSGPACWRYVSCSSECGAG